MHKILSVLNKHISLVKAIIALFRVKNTHTHTNTWGGMFIISADLDARVSGIHCRKESMAKAVANAAIPEQHNIPASYPHFNRHVSLCYRNHHEAQNEPKI